MATINRYTTAKGTRWEVRYRTPQRTTSRKRGFTSRRQAEDWLHENQAKVNRGQWQPAHVGKITLREFSKSWIETKVNLSANSKRAYRNSLDHFETAGLAGMYLKDIKPIDIEKWVAEISKTLSAKTVKNDYNVLFSIMKKAVRDDHIAASPCIEIALPRVEKKDQIFLTSKQVESLAEAAGANKDIVIFLAKTGLRWGEMAGLEVRDVDFSSEVLHVRRQITEVKGKLHRSRPKHNKERIVPLMPSVVELLRKRIGESTNVDQLVFRTVTGSVLRSGNAQRDWFDQAAKSIGIPGLTPHHLRHSFASLAIRAGANPKALQQALGHASITTTMDRYAHLYPDDSRSFVLGMDSLFS